MISRFIIFTLVIVYNSYLYSMSSDGSSSRVPSLLELSFKALNRHAFVLGTDFFRENEVALNHIFNRIMLLQDRVAQMKVAHRLLLVERYQGIVDAMLNDLNRSMSCENYQDSVLWSKEFALRRNYWVLREDATAANVIDLYRTGSNRK